MLESATDGRTSTMMEDGTIDYSRYSSSDLEDVLAHIDSGTNPLNHRNLIAEIESRRRDPAYRGMVERAAQSRTSAGSPYATIPRRIVAAFIDSFMLAPASLIWVLWSMNSSTAVYVACALLHQALWYSYSIIGHGMYGRTIGKWIAGVRLLHHVGGPVTMKQAFLRDSPGVLLAVTYIAWYARPLMGLPDGARSWQIEMFLTFVGTVWFLLEIGSALFHPKRRALHDLIAGTVVEKTSFPWSSGSDRVS